MRWRSCTVCFRFKRPFDTAIISNHVILPSLLEEAGRTILTPAFTQHIETRVKADGSIVTHADEACQHFLCKKLHDIAPDTSFMGEEMTLAEQQQCLDCSASFWCLDPLDGTGNFAAGFPMFSISLALIDQGQVQQACIHDPIRHETFYAERGKGAWLNKIPLHSTLHTDISAATGFADFKRLDQTHITQLISNPVYRSLRNIGSSALEWAWMAAGRAHFIIHGGQKLWDYAAGSLIAEEVGCISSDFDSHALFSNIQLSRSIIAASTPEIHHILLQQIRNV